MGSVLLIGLGRWGQVHLKTWRALGARLLLCDAREDLLAKAREEGPCTIATDYKRLLDEADIVDIVTPAPSHFALASECLRAGKDVHVEKPLCATAAESYELAGLADTSGRLLQVGHVFRFEPAIDAVRDVLASGSLGRVLYLTAHFQSFKRPRTDGGAAISDGVHFVDLASYLMGKQPRAVNAVTRDYLGRGMEDVAFITLEFGGGEVAHIEASYFPAVKKRDLEVVCEGGVVHVDFLAAKEKVLVYRQKHDRRGAEWVAAEGERQTIDVRGDEPLRRELAAFARCCETREAPLVDGYAGAHAVAAIEAAFASAAMGRSVQVDIRHPAYAR
jgi:UDP-2-acetamido-3-amino-2,3-dideoxy-glucuronate N-acetyltransferase